MEEKERFHDAAGKLHIIMWDGESEDSERPETGDERWDRLRKEQPKLFEKKLN